MLPLIKSEFKKLRRSSIIFVGVCILILAPLLSILQQISRNEPIKDYGFRNIVDATIWYNMSLFMPVLLMLLGGYMINREYVDDTMKSLLTIPISYKRLIWGKLMTLGVLTVLYSAYSFIITLLLSFMFFPKGLILVDVLTGAGQIIGMGFCVYIAVLPAVAWCGAKRNRYLAGSVLVFLYGFLSIPISGRGIQDIYPMTAGLTIINYGGDTGSLKTGNSPEVAIAVLLIMMILTYFILYLQDKKYE